MKNTIQLLTFALMVFFFQSCSKGENSNNSSSGSDGTIPGPTTTSLRVTLSSTQISADGFDETTVNVKDSTNADVTNSSVIFVNNTAITGNKFYTSIAGNYQVIATRSGVSSPAATLTAVNPGASPFTQKVLAESFSGTWCGICPGTIIPLENYTNTHPNAISVGIHGPSGSSDPFQYIFDPQLRTAYNITGVPTVLLNRNSIWTNNNTATLDELLQKRAPLGIGLTTSITGNTINVKAKVKFDITTSFPLKIIVMLAEDNIKYNQANYGHFGLPNPIINFNHRNVLRAAATDIFGDALPTNQQMKGNIWEKDYMFNGSNYVLSNCKIIAFVFYGDNAANRKGVLNVQIASAGENKNFD